MDQRRDNSLKVAFAGVVAFLMLALTSSCDQLDRVAYSHYESIGGEGWDPAMVVGFSPAPTDSTLSSNQEFYLVLNIRYKGDTPAKELPLLISEENSDGEMASQTIKVQIRDKNGMPRGKKGLVLYELSDTIRTDFKVPDGYWIEITSMCPAEYSRGITEVGLELIR